MRLRSLDGLRGLAALCVLVMHWHQTFPGWTKPIPSAFSAAFWNNPVLLLLHHTGHVLALGGSAVIVFFVLSGFVLAISLEVPGESYAGYAVKRALRIYPPFAFAVILAAVLFLIADPRPIPQLTDWFNHDPWTDWPSPALVAGHLAMLGTPYYESLDPVIWSLIHEMRISLVFPVIAYCVSRRLGFSLFLSLAASGIALFVAHRSSPMTADWALTVHYSVWFFAGAAMAQNRSIIGQWITTRNPGISLLLWFASGACLFMPPEFLDGWMVYIVGLGATGIVGLCYSDPHAIKFLEHRLPLYLGKISYSLYLVHLPVLLAVMHMFYGKAPAWILVLAGTAAIFAIADLANRFVERPFQKMGRRLVALQSP